MVFSCGKLWESWKRNERESRHKQELDDKSVDNLSYTWQLNPDGKKPGKIVRFCQNGLTINVQFSKFSM